MFYTRSRRLGTLLSVIAAVACATGGEAEEGRPASGGGANAGPTGGSGATDAGAAATGGSGGSSAITGGTGGSNVLPDASIAGMAGLGAAGVDGEAGAAGAAGAGDAGCALVLEVCNGLDDDCDGRIDEDNPGGDNLCLVTGARGVCVAGATRCASGFISCVSLSAPSAESCNGLDDDCDGTTDEGNPGSDQPCDTGLFGLCASGLTRCTDGATECIPSVTAQTEACNGLDDDCDGTPDDGFAGAGQPCTVPNQPPNTPCAQGLTNCLGGQSGCTQTRGPVPEQCNGVDDDCDGTLDNPAAVDGKTCSTGLPGACATGKTECSSGTLQCVPDVAPGTRIEVCNGIDDDCNGILDDGATVGSDCAQRHSLSQNVAGWQCVNGTCTVASCSGSFADCDGAAGNGCETNTGASPVNCGTCGKVCNATNGTPGCVNGGCTIACDTGYGNCDGIAATGCETPVSVDALNCGTCGRVCSTLNGTAACVSGACQIACKTGFADCDGSALNGCESNLASPTSCAACGRVCSTTNGTPTCVAGTCGIVCSAGWGNCDGNPDTGCEASLATTQNCGGCGNACSSQGGTPACTGGVCSGITCNAGLANCDGDSANGCEVNTDGSVANCGACGNACSAVNGSPSCSGGVCSIVCISGFGNCDSNPANGCETNLNVDAGHCGTCGNRCPTTNGTASCSSATCSITCNAGFGNCDGVIGNGCELDLRDSVVHCGSCTTNCSSANGTPSCQAQVCAIACNTGFANCDGNATNGCEANLTSTAHCGVCGRECSANNGIPSCTSGVCGIACSPGFADCDANVANGCETSITSTTNCGSCGNACSSSNGTPSCVGGACSIACNSGFGNCDGSAVNGCETNLQTSSSHCSFCGNACSSVNGTPSCNLGSCSIICGPSFGNCDGNVGNGCETNTSSDPAHCGTCTTVCGAQNGTPLCTSGTCSVSCNLGFANCDGSVTNGCETNTNADAGHCGSCTTVCSAANGSASCSGGSCAITCNAGFGNCDANLGNGCETSTVADPAHCGSCTNVCNSTGGTPQCVAGVCSGIGCSSGFADCDSNAANGCETQLGTLQNCASCGNVCSTNHATASCSGGTCQITCAAGFSNCDGSLQNGCETDVNSVANCGGCGQPCSAAGGTPSCASGQCSIACATGFANCDGNARTNGCEVDTRISVSHCGGCNQACSTANGTATCSGSNCSITCNPPFANCDGNARTNGCEVNTNTNLQHCGGCSSACSTANGTATCSSGTCSIVCTAPFADCDGNARANGCEANVNTSPANCGGCGAACSSGNGTASCSTGTCAIACNAGYADCDANARSNGCETNTDSDPMHCGSCTDTCSGVCTGGACTVASCPFGYVFCDDFEDGVADGWTKSGGTWSVLDEAGDKVYQGGASEESWAGSSSTDQTVTAQVRVVQFGGTSDSYRAGILARRSAPSDFYALQVRPDGMLSIRKGTTILSGCQTPSGVTVTQWFELKLQVSGPPASVTLRGFVNGGSPKLTCTHTNGLASGQVGFVTYGTGTSARFDDIKVSTP